MIWWMLACMAPPSGAPALRLALDGHDREELPSLEVVDATSAVLTAAPYSSEVAGRLVDGYAYNESLPGPLLVAEVGDVLSVELVNELDSPTTIHWHGAGAPFEMDGVTWQREPTSPQGRFTYQFPLERSGTFWYHPHFDTDSQVDLGLYGMLVVQEPDAPAVDADLSIVLDSWGESLELENQHGLDGNDLQWTANGVIDPVATVDGRWVRLRLLNASNTGYVELDTSGMTLLGTDQGVTAARQLDRLVLSPGDRAELLVDATDAVDLWNHPYSLHGGASWGEPTRLLTLRSAGGGGPRPTWDRPADPPSPDPGWTDITYTFQGDNASDVWRINHEVFPDVTVETVALGAEIVMEVRNLSPTHHPFHAHGHAFEVLSRNGVPPTQRTVEDTIDLGIYETVRLGFEADRVGSWMQHCHILPHADGGMMTVLEVLP